MNNSVPSTYSNKDADAFWLTGCLETQQAYQVSPLKSCIFLVLENLAGLHEVLAALDNHPGSWPTNGLVAVSMLVTAHGGFLTVEDQKLLTTHAFQSLSHLPASKVGSITTVMDVEPWIDSCPYPTLQRFAYQVLGEPNIGCRFFSYPASANHHHCYPGGLAEHSLEVAQSVYAVSSSFSEHERWLAALAGLLHDLGKVRSMQPDGRRTETGYLVSHELLGYELALPALNTLEKEWPDGANGLRYLFEWLIKPKQQRPVLPVALAIKQADIMSAAANNRQKVFSDKPVWQTFARCDGPGPESTFWLPRPPHAD